MDIAAGQPLEVSATCSGGKKDAQIMCAFNACRSLGTWFSYVCFIVHCKYHLTACNWSSKKMTINIVIVYMCNFTLVYFRQTWIIISSQKWNKEKSKKSRGQWLLWFWWRHFLWPNRSNREKPRKPTETCVGKHWMYGINFFLCLRRFIYGWYKNIGAQHPFFFGNKMPL